MGGYCKIVNRSAWPFWPWFAFFVLQIYEFISFVQNNSSKKNGGLKWSFQRTSRNERSSRVENVIFLSLFLFKISIFDDIVICIPTLPLTYCLIFSPYTIWVDMRQKSEKSAEKWSFEITNPHFCHAYKAKLVYYRLLQRDVSKRMEYPCDAKFALLSPIDHLFAHRTRTRAHNTRTSNKILVFLLSQVSQQKNKRILIFKETTRRL